jgi:elongin-A
MIRRDIPNWESKNYAPKNPTKWYNVYCRYKQELRIELAKDEEDLKARMAELNKKKATHVSKIVELKTLPKVPKDPWMMANNGGVPIGRSRETGVIKRSASVLTWTTGSKTKLRDGKSVMTKARREAKEISQRGRLARPTHELHGKAGQIKQAPVGMVDQYRRDGMAPRAPIKILSKKRNIPGPVGVTSGTLRAQGLSLEERESRLRALTMQIGKTYGAVEPTLISSEDEDEDDMEDLFDEKPKQTTHAKPNVVVRSTPSQASSIQRSPVSFQPRQSGTSLPSSPSLWQKPAPRTKPSDVISSMIMKPKSNLPPKPPPPTSSSPPTNLLRSDSPTQFNQSSKVIKRRPPPDVFNRDASKKQRLA